MLAMSGGSLVLREGVLGGLLGDEDEEDAEDDNEEILPVEEDRLTGR